MTVDEASCSSLWTKEQNKAFENALATYPEDALDRWEKIAADVPGKTLDQIKHHYELLVDDVARIESGCVTLPNYNSSSEGSKSHGGDEGTTKKGSHVGQHNGESHQGHKVWRSEQERRKGIAWSEEEHRLFLLGLEKFGKGDWRSISRNFVLTRTPTQVASHAQKYFIRLNSMNKDRRRNSIHDITSVDNADNPLPQGPITGQSNGSAAVGFSAKAAQPPPQNVASRPGVGIYTAPTIGHPIGGPRVSAVGTPMNLQAPAHIAYGIGAPVPGTIVPGAPVAPMTDPMLPTVNHR